MTDDVPIDENPGPVTPLVTDVVATWLGALSDGLAALEEGNTGQRFAVAANASGR